MLPKLAGLSEKSDQALQRTFQSINVCAICFIEFHHWVEYHEHINTAHEDTETKKEDEDLVTAVRLDVNELMKKREYKPMKRKDKIKFVARGEKRLGQHFFYGGPELTTGGIRE